MCSEKALVPMGFTHEEFPAGAHMCLIYKSEEERRKIIGKFLEAGVANREMVNYFCDVHSPLETKNWLEW